MGQKCAYFVFLSQPLMPLPCLTKANVCKIRENEGLFIQVKSKNALFMCQRSLSSPGPNESSPSSQFPLPIFEGKAEMTEIERGGFYTGERNWEIASVETVG